MYIVIVPVLISVVTQYLSCPSVFYSPVEMWWLTVTHGRGSIGETGEWSGYPVPSTLPRNMVYPALLPLMRTPLLPVVDWTDAPADLNGLVRFAERRNLVSARVLSHLNWPLPEEPPGEAPVLLCGVLIYCSPTLWYGKVLCVLLPAWLWDQFWCEFILKHVHWATSII
jgi:hypothetical protein